MKVATGTVSDGRIVVEGNPFAEGEKVTVLGDEGNESFRLSPAEKKQLMESIAQADRGEFVDADDLLAELDESN
jgi:hypothetical protein